MQRLFYFSLALLVSIVLVAFGYYLIFLHINSINSSSYFLAGLILVLGAIFIVPAGYVKYRLQIAAAGLLIGAYLLARAAGIFHELWMAKIIGIACWLAVIVLIYVFWPTKKAKDA